MQSLFSYKKTNSLIHRCPVLIKLIILLAVPITTYIFNIYYCIGLMVCLALLAILSKTGFSLFIKDLKPIIYYCFFLLLIDCASFFIFKTTDQIITFNTIFMVLKLICAMQAASVFFRTTSTYQIRESLQNLESFLTAGHTSYSLSSTFTLFLSFIPQVFETWNNIKLSSKARGAKTNIFSIIRLLPTLIILSIRKANTTYLALLNRY